MAENIQRVARTPPLGELIAPAGGNLTPPKTPEEQQTRFTEIREFLRRSEVQAGLLQFAVGALQPIGPGDTPLSALARAGAGGLQAAGRVQAAETEEEEKEFKRQRELAAEELELDKLTAAEKRQRIAAKASTDVATTGAVSRQKVAETTVSGARDRLTAEIKAKLTAAGLKVTTDADKASLLAQATRLAQETLVGTDKDAALLTADARVQAARDAVTALVDASALKATAEVTAADVAGDALSTAERLKAKAKVTAAQAAVASLSGPAKIKAEAALKAAETAVDALADAAELKAAAVADVRPNFRVLTSEEKTAFGIAPGAFAQVNKTDNKVTINRPTGLKLRIGENGELELVTGSGELSPATKDRATRTARASEELLTNLGILRTQLESGGDKVIGPLAAFQGLVNITAASFVPALFAQDREDFSSQLAITKEASKRAVSDEQRFTDQDRKFVNALFPSEGVFTNKEKGITQLRVMTAFFIRRLAPNLEAAGIDVASIPTLDVPDLLDLAGTGLMVRSEVFDALDNIFPEQPQDLKSLLGAMVQKGFSLEQMDPIVRELFPGSLRGK